MTRRDEIEIKSRSEILLMREAGLVVARTLEAPRHDRFGDVFGHGSSLLAGGPLRYGE